MIQSQRSLPVVPLHAVTVRRRRALRVGLPAASMAMARPADEIVWQDRSWKDDLSFFLAAYAAGMLFFLVMLS